jgi:hypothetical protein
VAKQSRTSFSKRERERKKAEKAARKRERREHRRNNLLPVQLDEEQASDFVPDSPGEHGERGQEAPPDMK